MITQGTTPVIMPGTLHKGQVSGGGLSALFGRAFTASGMKEKEGDA